MAGRVEGKVAFITGAARGQGRSHAIRLAQEGADIIAIDLCADVDTVPYAGARPFDLNETVTVIEALGRRIVSKIADVRDYESIASALDDGVNELGHVDIVSANAGIFSSGSVADLTEQAWTQMLDINLSGVWRTCKAAIPHLLSQGTGGSIVITSSLAGMLGTPNIGHYVSAKAGLNGLMRTLSNELAPHWIRVNCLNPTCVNTDMLHNEALHRLFVPGPDLPSDEAFAAASSSLHSLPIPWVESIDISNALLFLASDEARYITGVTLPVDGGAFAR